jgi:hypothetical protein
MLQPVPQSVFLNSYARIKDKILLLLPEDKEAPRWQACFRAQTVNCGQIHG